MIHSDVCTIDKARMDFARILISTPIIVIVNKTTEFFIDGSKYVIKLVEEWDCNLGEDAFMTEGESDSRHETSSLQNDVDGFEEVQGEWEVDDLVNDLHNNWSQHEVKKNELRKAANLMSPKKDSVKDGTGFFNVQLSPVLEPMEQPFVDMSSKMSGNNQESTDSRQQGINNTGQWSIDWMNNHQSIVKEGFIFSSVRKDVSNVKHVLKTDTTQNSKSYLKKKKGAPIKNSVGFMKRIARILDNDRKQILHILKKHKRDSKRKEEVGNNNSSSAAVPILECSKNSKNSSSSVNKDLENWVVLHGKKEAVAADVRDGGKGVGLQYQCDTTNSFKLLSKEGRREWRAEGGCEIGRGRDGGTEGVVEE
jgi:hypothetical protein